MHKIDQVAETRQESVWRCNFLRHCFDIFPCGLISLFTVPSPGGLQLHVGRFAITGSWDASLPRTNERKTSSGTGARPFWREKILQTKKEKKERDKSNVPPPEKEHIGKSFNQVSADWILKKMSQGWKGRKEEKRCWLNVLKLGRGNGEPGVGLSFHFRLANFFWKMKWAQCWLNFEKCRKHLYFGIYLTLKMRQVRPIWRRPRDWLWSQNPDPYDGRLGYHEIPWNIAGLMKPRSYQGHENKPLSNILGDYRILFYL